MGQPRNRSVVRTGNSIFNGVVALTTDKMSSTYYLRDPSRGNQYTINLNNRTSGGSVFTDADNIWGNGTTSNTQTIGADAQYGTAMTWDYYKVVHGCGRGRACPNAGHRCTSAADTTVEGPLMSAHR